MKRTPLIIAAVVVALPIAGLVAARSYLTPDALRARIEAAVQKATGRQLTISGPIRVGWSLTPTIEVNDVRLANPPGFSRPELAQFARIEARIGLLPLLSRRLEVSGLTLIGPDVLLERDAQGRPNWIISRPAPTAASSPASADGGEKFSVQVGEVAISDAKLGFRGHQLFEIAAPRLIYDPRPGRIAGDLIVRGTTLHVAGTAAPLDLHLDGSGLQLAVTGTTVTAEIADLSSLSSLAGTSLPALRNVRFETKATLAPSSLALDDLKLTSAQGDLAGHLTFAATPRPSLRGALTSTHFDLDAPPPATPAAPSPATPSPATPSPATPQKPPDRLIPDTPIPYAALRGADADLQLDAAALSWRGKTYAKLVAHIVLQDGKLAVAPLGMALGDKPLSAAIHADAGPQTIAAKIDAPGLPAGPVVAAMGGPSATGTIDLYADLHAQGATWRMAAAALQGNLGLAMVDGEIDNAWLADKLQDALRAANLPMSAGGDSKLRCAALRADASAGIVRLTALTLDTTKLELDGTGEINLADETLDLHLRPTLRLGAALSVPLHLGGTLRAPKMVLDAGAIAPGRVGISIGGPPPADTCGPALALARGGEPGPMPTTPEPANRPLKPADLLRGLLR